MSVESFLRGKVEGTFAQKIFRRFKDFVALNFPNLYEEIWKFRKGVKYTDAREKILVEMKNSPPVFRLKKSFDYSLELPLNFQTDFAEKKIAAVVHIFYPELAEEIKKLLQNIPGNVDVFISTDTAEKISALEKVFADFGKGTVTVKVFENRGRDIAPAFVGFSDVYKNYDLCVHLHSKKSPHAQSRLFGWRDYLYKNLLGSEEIVRGIFQIAENPHVGIIFPQYFTQIRLSINWGENFFSAKKFLSRLGIELGEKVLLEFPAGSMFWFKPAALAKLFASGITFADFEPELGQTDGTLAHALERSFLFIARQAGFFAVKTSAQVDKLTPTLKSNSKAELEKNISQCIKLQK